MLSYIKLTTPMDAGFCKNDAEELVKHIESEINSDTHLRDSGLIYFVVPYPADSDTLLQLEDLYEGAGWSKVRLMTDQDGLTHCWFKP